MAGRSRMTICKGRGKKSWCQFTVRNVVLRDSAYKFWIGGSLPKTGFVN